MFVLAQGKFTEKLKLLCEVAERYVMQSITRGIFHISRLSILLPLHQLQTADQIVTVGVLYMQAVMSRNKTEGEIDWWHMCIFSIH
jgi:hypothetical protein